jgi:PAS domain S-box-containing protein
MTATIQRTVSKAAWVEAELRASEARLRLVQKVSGVAHYDRVLSDDVAMISAEFTRMFGLPPEQTQITSAELLALVHPDDRDRIADTVPHTLAQGDKFTAEFRIRLPGGGLRWISARTGIFPGPDGQPSRVIAALQDITEIVAAREVLAARHDELERSNAELEQFAHTISHDLKAPLRAIGNLAQWIGEDMKEIATPETIDNLDLLQGRVERMQKLLAGLMDYSRVGQIEKAIEDVAVADVVSNIVAMQAPPPGFAITYEGEEPTLRTHPVALQVVLANLISNSLKHHDRDQGCITVRTRRVDGLAEFRVSDDGPGIPEQFHRRIFEIFQTLQSRDDRESSGIGLAIVKRKVESHGGRIWIESAPPARGTSFVFTWQEAAA